MDARFLHSDADGLLAEVDLGVYGLGAVMRAAHRFTGRCFIHLRRSGADRVEVRFLARPGGGALETVAGEFLNELLDQRLRDIVAAETELERNLILAHALSRAPFLAAQRSQQDGDAS